MPFNKEKNRRIYITALVISFLLIVGSIYLHLKQKTHLGRMRFNLDRERVKPTSGVDPTTRMDDNDYSILNQTNELSSSKEDYKDEDKRHGDLTPVVAKVTVQLSSSRQPESNDNINQKSPELMSMSEDHDDEIFDDFPKDIDQNSEYEIRSLGQDSNACLRCLCMTVNECRPTFCGTGNPCGLYRISKRYWIDAGKPTIAGGTTDNDDQDYLTCVNEDTCATTVIRQYYNRYKRDCNKDGIFDCRDQIALHLLGPSGCLTDSLSSIHANRMKNCFIESNLNFSYSTEEVY